MFSFSNRKLKEEFQDFKELQLKSNIRLTDMIVSTVDVVENLNRRIEKLEKKSTSAGKKADRPRKKLYEQKR